MSRTPKTANVPKVPAGLDRSLTHFLTGVKESIEVSRGRAGEQESFVTKKFLEEKGYLTTAEGSDSSSGSSGSSGSGDSSSGSSSGSSTRRALGIHEVKTANIADRAVTELKIAVGAVINMQDVEQHLMLRGGVSIMVPVADIDNPTELADFTSVPGNLLLAYEVDANQNYYTIYAYDSANASGASSPYVVAGSSGFWVAIGGTYASGVKAIILDDDGIIGLGAAKGRIEFDDQATDEINFLDCVVGVGTSVPSEKVTIKGTTNDGTTYPLGLEDSDAAEILKVDTNGMVDLLGGQIKFPSTAVASADANTLDDYDEYTAASTACTGALTVSVIWKLVKIGRVVTLTLPTTKGAGVAVANISYGVVLPVKYRPTQNLQWPITIYDNGTVLAAPGVVIILITGAIVVFKEPTGTVAFTVTANAGIEAIGLSWVV
jgi:hypothetical protein